MPDVVQNCVSQGFEQVGPDVAYVITPRVFEETEENLMQGVLSASRVTHDGEAEQQHRGAMLTVPGLYLGSD